MDCIKLNHFEYMLKKLVKLRTRVRECLTSSNIAWSVFDAEDKEMFKDFREHVIEEASEIRERYWEAHKSLFDCFELIRDRLCSKRNNVECDHCDNEDCCMSQEELRHLYDDLSKTNRLIFDLERTVHYEFPLTSGEFMHKVRPYLQSDLKLW